MKSRQSIPFFNQSGYLQQRFNIELRKELLLELITNSEGKEIIDLGCGDGSISDWLGSKNTLWLVDASDSMIAAAEKRIEAMPMTSRIIVVKSDLFDFHPPNPVDGALCLGLVAHVPNTSLLLQHYHKILKTGGWLVIQNSDSDHRAYRNASAENDVINYGYPLTRIGKFEFEKILYQEGFQVINSKSYQWAFRPLNRMPQQAQKFTLNLMRKSGLFRKFESEYIYLCVKV